MNLNFKATPEGKARNRRIRNVLFLHFYRIFLWILRCCCADAYNLLALKFHAHLFKYSDTREVVCQNLHQFNLKCSHSTLVNVCTYKAWANFSMTNFWAYLGRGDKFKIVCLSQKYTKVLFLAIPYCAWNCVTTTWKTSCAITAWIWTKKLLVLLYFT